LAANGSTRAGAGAPISMPVTWATLPRTTAGNRFTILNSKNISRPIHGPAWAEIGKVKLKFPG
jgi:DNA primase